jgi:uncharacterized protein YjbI with pentapeptide repeats
MGYKVKVALSTKQLLRRLLVFVEVTGAVAESEKLPRIHCQELLQLYQQGTRYFGKMNLVGVDLSYQDLTEIDLTGTNLRGRFDCC